MNLSCRFQTGGSRTKPQRDFVALFSSAINCALGMSVRIEVGNHLAAMHYFRMSKLFIALLLLATPAFAQERPTAYQALRMVGTQLNRDYVNHVISVTGMDGNPQPATWKVLLDDPKARGGVRQVEVGDGRIVSERTPLRAAVEESLGPVIDTAKLNLDSSGAYTVAQQTAASSHVNATTADYALRVDDRGNPVWEITLRRENGEPAGRISIGANHGTITRTEGLFRGGDRAPSFDEPADEQQPEDADEDNDGDTNVVKLRIKRAFHQVRDDVKRSFFKVRRSFVDFFQDK